MRKKTTLFFPNKVWFFLLGSRPFDWTFDVFKFTWHELVKTRNCRLWCILMSLMTTNSNQHKSTASDNRNERLHDANKTETLGRRQQKKCVQIIENCRYLLNWHCFSNVFIAWINNSLRLQNASLKTLLIATIFVYFMCDTPDFGGCCISECFIDRCIVPLFCLPLCLDWSKWVTWSPRFRKKNENE